MKNLFLPIILFTGCINVASSQNYQVIEWDLVGVSHLIPTDDTSGSGVRFHTEIRGNINDIMSIGLRYDWMFLGDESDELIRGLDVKKSYALTADYYFLNSANRRAFAGLAIGSFNSVATTESGIGIGGNGFRLGPRVGYELDIHLRLTGEYNISFEERVPSYFSIGLALNLGGRFKYPG